MNDKHWRVVAGSVASYTAWVWKCEAMQKRMDKKDDRPIDTEKLGSGGLCTL